MAKKVALITIHGMGRIKPNYHSELEAGLIKLLENKWTEVSFQNVQYAPILQGPEDALWNAMINCPGNKLDGESLRKIFLYGFADAGSLEHSLKKDKKVYIKTQLEIFLALEKALIDLEGDETKPVVIVAQSLGCQVISNYIWDAQNNLNLFGPEGSEFLKSRTISDFHRLKSLSNLITTGCNIPLFVAGIPERVCFNKPNEEFEWNNYYDKDDLLGWPLRQLGESYDIVSDCLTNVGGLFTSWSTSSHGKYWSDSSVLKPVALMLSKKIQE